ncbi:LysR family transcriptional regulator [Microbacterium sp. JB110]|uniref:LysR family transcriptional regulator n=1 Tax=Microbacterium sp. JB110 TaxID=2024477 RepID=UPI00097F06E0|nr:LysR family transcriptional regulator [Microbacterium sp. JB110]RCS63186.1 LysR family transcriptional regulator [Microbacterium sp. JB110]SJM52579.1 Transcriptional regulator, LysR family [Frigoribacterium sp. JB110]
MTRTGEPDLEALRALSLVAAERSMSAASAHLGVSQQAVSLRIRGLENDLGARLLVRSARGSQLTPAGEVVVGWAARLLASADEFSDAVATLRTDRRRTIRIAASLTIAEHLLPEWIAGWRIRTGDDGPMVQLTAENSSAVIESVRAGSADLGFIETPFLPDDLGSVVVAHDTVDVVAQPGHRWARSGSVSARELAATSLVLREQGSGTRRALEDALLAADCPVTAEPAAVLSTTLGVRSAIMAGAAPGALSSLAVADDIRAGRLVRVEVGCFRMERPLAAVWSGTAPQPGARDFLDVVARRPRR